MTHDEKIIEAVATAEVRYDGYEDLLCLSRTMRERYLDRARAAITAYKAEAWQGISTAKHGERILVWNAMAGAYTSEMVHGQWPLRLWDGVTGNWFPAPTHWQPLPPAPKATP